MFDKKEKKQYLCNTCGHYGICMYEKDYIKAQDKVDNGLIDVMVETPFIRPVKLECRYFVRVGLMPTPR